PEGGGTGPFPGHQRRLHRRLPRHAEAVRAALPAVRVRAHDGARMVRRPRQRAPGVPLRQRQPDPVRPALQPARRRIDRSVRGTARGRPACPGLGDPAAGLATAEEGQRPGRAHAGTAGGEPGPLWPPARGLDPDRRGPSGAGAVLERGPPARARRMLRGGDDAVAGAGYSARSSSSTPARPTTEMVDSITVHERKVWAMDRPKNSLNIQKAESLTWEPNTLPAPTASTISSGDTPVLSTSGPTTPAAVITATVEEPIITRSSAVASQANSSGGIWHCPARAAMVAPTPLSTSTCLNTPPAVMISRITAMPPMAALSQRVCCSRPTPRHWPRNQNASRVDTSRATVDFPRNSSAVRTRPSGSTPSATTETLISSTGDSAIRNEHAAPVSSPRAPSSGPLNRAGSGGLIDFSRR